MTKGGVMIGRIVSSRIARFAGKPVRVTISAKHKPSVVAAVAVLGIWASTFFIQVPVHNRLCVAFDADLHGRLVQSNWIRTVLWSVRSVLMFRVVWGLCGKG